MKGRFGKGLEERMGAWKKVEKYGKGRNDRKKRVVGGVGASERCVEEGV